MEDSSKYNIEVESILGGLESALARGQPLERAMTSFRNAGYKERNIIEAARKFQILHRRRFHELGVDPNKPKKIVGAVPHYGPGGIEEPEKKKEEQRPRELVPAKTREKLIEQYEREKMEMETRSPHHGFFGGDSEKEKKDSEKEKDSEKDKKDESDEDYESDKDSSKPRRRREKPSKKTQVVSGYGDEALRASENFRDAIDEMVKSLSKIQLVQPPASGKKQKPQVVNKISNYGMKPPSPVSKAVTFLLIFLLILLLGVLAAVFFFREELIDLFNTFSLE